MFADIQHDMLLIDRMSFHCRLWLGFMVVFEARVPFRVIEAIVFPLIHDLSWGGRSESEFIIDIDIDIDIDIVPIITQVYSKHETWLIEGRTARHVA